MTNRSPRLTGKEVKRALERLGFFVKRVKGSHHFMKHPDGRGVSVPVHGNETLGIGLLGDICEDAMITIQHLKDNC